MWLAKEKNVAIIGLNYKDDRDEALAWLDRLGDPYQSVIYDPRGTLGFDLGVYGAPETFVIDASGVVRYRHVGVVNETVWEQTLLPVVNEARGNG
jgi:cytochrome c biogenesis protein CcmG/thiol:disulfide interchange protein DsbE